MPNQTFTKPGVKVESDFIFLITSPYSPIKWKKWSHFLKIVYFFLLEIVAGLFILGGLVLETLK